MIQHDGPGEHVAAGVRFRSHPRNCVRRFTRCAGTWSAQRRAILSSSPRDHRYAVYHRWRRPLFDACARGRRGLRTVVCLERIAAVDGGEGPPNWAVRFAGTRAAHLPSFGDPDRGARQLCRVGVAFDAVALAGPIAGNARWKPALRLELHPVFQAWSA